MLQLHLILTFIAQRLIDCISCCDILLCFLKVCQCDRIIMTLFPMSSVSFFVHNVIAIVIRVINVIAINVISASVIITTITLMLLLKLTSFALHIFLLISLKKLARPPSSFDWHTFVKYPTHFVEMLKQIKFNLSSTMRARVDMHVHDSSIINILYFKKDNKC